MLIKHVHFKRRIQIRDGHADIFGDAHPYGYVGYIRHMSDIIAPHFSDRQPFRIRMAIPSIKTYQEKNTNPMEQELAQSDLPVRRKVQKTTQKYCFLKKVTFSGGFLDFSPNWLG